MQSRLIVSRAVSQQVVCRLYHFVTHKKFVSPKFFDGSIVQLYRQLAHHSVNVASYLRTSAVFLKNPQEDHSIDRTVR